MAKVIRAKANMSIKDRNKPFVFPALHNVPFAGKMKGTKAHVKMRNDEQWAFVLALFDKVGSGHVRVPFALRLAMALIALSSNKHNAGKRTRLSVCQYDLFDLTVWQEQWPNRYRKEYWHAAVEGLEYIRDELSIVRNHNGEKHRWVELEKIPGVLRSVQEKVIATVDYSPLLVPCERNKSVRILQPNSAVVFKDSLQYVSSYSKWRAFWLLQLMVNKNKNYAPAFSRQELADMLFSKNPSHGAAYFENVAKENGLEVIKLPAKYLRPSTLKFVRRNTNISQ